MSDRAAHSTISDMENDILAVGRWAGVLIHLGCTTSRIDPGEIWVISGVLAEVAERLESRWQQAFAQTGGRP